MASVLDAPTIGAAHSGRFYASNLMVIFGPVASRPGIVAIPMQLPFAVAMLLLAGRIVRQPANRVGG